jgi:nitroreductase
MDEDLLYQAIFRRKSVRKFESSPLDQDTIASITSQFSSLTPMLEGIRTEVTLMTGEQVHGLFKVDAPHFIALFSEPKEGYLLNAGFMVQQLDLFLSAKGIGSCWQGGPKPTKMARAASGLEFVVLLAFGKPAEKVHRESISEFKRDPMSKITSIKGMDDLLEPARIAPSGMNGQPWFFNDGNGMINAYCHKAVVGNHMNQIGVGIALSHIWLAARHKGGSAQLSISPGSGDGPRRYAYAASLKLK